MKRTSSAREPGSLAEQGLTTPSKEQLSRAGVKASRSRNIAKELETLTTVSVAWKTKQ